MNKTLTIGIIVALVAVVAGGLWVWGGSMLSGFDQYGAPYTNNGNRETAKGTVYVSIKDAAVNMQNVTKVEMAVDKIYLHSQGGGWVTLSQDSQTFSLLELKEGNKAALAAKTESAAGTYDQIWLHVASVKVTENGRVKEAVLPSGDIIMGAYVKVIANADSSAMVDIIADESLHKTAKGEFIFAPVIAFESRSNAAVAVGTDNMVIISGGTVDATATAGMDITGEVKNNFKLDLAADLEVDAGIINIK